jgi:hypothetical protein
MKIEEYITKIAVATPVGFTKQATVGYHDGSYHHTHNVPPGDTAVVIEKDDVRIVFNIGTKKKDDYPKGTTIAASGHTLFKTAKGWHNLSRRGVDDAFYTNELEEPSVVIEREIARAQASKKRSEELIDVPGLPFRVHPEKLPEIKAKLAKGKVHELHPYGFGIGYRLAKRLSSWAKPAPPETSAFFGVRLVMETMDCD